MKITTDAQHSTLGSTQAPLEVGALGEYAVATITGTMAANLGAAAPIFAVRWGSSASLGLIRRVSISMASLGTGFTAGVGIFDMIAARAFTVSDSAGTAVTLTTNNAKKRTTFGTTGVTDMRISSTATLTAGTRTLDANALTNLMFAVSTATNTVMLPTTTLWQPDLGANEWPLVLAQNEGFIIRATVPATGTWQAQVKVDWSEVISYP